MEPDNHPFGKENIFQTTIFWLYTSFPGYNCIESCHILLTLWLVCDSLIPWFLTDIQIQTYSDLQDQNHHILFWTLHFFFKRCVWPFCGKWWGWNALLLSTSFPPCPGCTWDWLFLVRPSMAATPPSALERLRHVSWVALSTLTVTPLGPKRGLASLWNIQTSSISSPGSSLLECLMCGSDQVHFGRLDIDITLYLTSNCFEGCGFKGLWFQMRKDNSSLVVGSNLQSALRFWHTQSCWVAIFKLEKGLPWLPVDWDDRVHCCFEERNFEPLATGLNGRSGFGWFSTEVCHDAPPGWWLLCQYVHQPHEGFRLQSNAPWSPSQYVLNDVLFPQTVYCWGSQCFRGTFTYG